MAVKKSDLLPTKHYVLDTNVLIHDPQSMFQFEENVVWVPVEVLEELDRFKSESSTRGANAREVHRRLSERFRTTEQMRAGVKLENGGWQHVYINPALKHEGHDWKLIEESPRSRLAMALFPDFDSTDNRILASAAYLADTQADGAVLVTKDLNMQLKARALGLDAQDYRTDRVEDNDIRRTQRRSGAEEYAAIDIAGHSLQAFASQERITLPHLEMLLPNQYVLLRNEEEPSHGVPARHLNGGEFVKLRHDHINIRGGRSLQAANLGQRFLLDALYDPSITLVTVYGKAGTGKTLLSVGAALEQVQTGEYEKMLITRVIMPTGRDIGFLPGRMEEKMQPWVQPAYDALDLLLSRPRKPEQFEKKKQSKRKAEGIPRRRRHQNENGNGKFAPLAARTAHASRPARDRGHRPHPRAFPAARDLHRRRIAAAHSARSQDTRHAHGQGQQDHPHRRPGPDRQSVRRCSYKRPRLHPQPPARPDLHGPREPLQRRAQRNGRSRGEFDVSGALLR